MDIISNSFYFKKARFGLIWYLKKFAKLDDSSVILLPELICNSLTEILEMSGFHLSYYKLDSKLNPLIDSINTKLSSMPNIKVIVYVNYFGIPPEIDSLKKKCEERNILLVEDNSHGFGGSSRGVKLGAVGDISISSPRKLYSQAIGGILSLNIVSAQANINKGFIGSAHSFNIDYQKIPVTNKLLHKYRIINSLKNKIRLIQLSFSDQNSPYSFREKKTKLIEFEPAKSLPENYLDWSTIIESRLEGWDIANKFIKSIGLEPLFIKDMQGLCPWAFPAICKDKNQRNKIIQYCYANSLSAFSWPCLPDTQISESAPAFQLWEKLICIPLNKVSIYSMQKINLKINH